MILILSTRMTEAYGSNGMKGIIFPPYSLLIPSLWLGFSVLQHKGTPLFSRMIGQITAAGMTCLA